MKIATSFSFAICMITILWASTIRVTAQPPLIQWQKCLGGSLQDYAFSLKQTPDSGFIAAGSAYSNDGDITNPIGNGDIWIVKLSSLGSMQWQKSIGGSLAEQPPAIQTTNDGGYIVAGRTSSQDGNVTNHHGGFDFWVVKLDNSGTIQWQKALGGSANDVTYDIQQTLDSGYIVTGYTASNDGDITNNHGGEDGWVVKLNPTGNLQWQMTYGGSLIDRIYTAKQTSDGGYIMTGMTSSTDGDITSNHGMADGWMIKTDTAGNIEWQKTFGGSLEDDILDVEILSNGYAITGTTNSSDGDILSNIGGYDLWTATIDNAGTIDWLTNCGGSMDEFGTSHSIQKTVDNGFILIGNSQSTDLNVINHGASDVYVVKLSSTGSIEWEQLYGGSNNDIGMEILTTFDSTYAFIANTESNNGDVTGFHNGTGNPRDLWIVKLNNPTSVHQVAKPHFKVYPTTVTQTVIIELLDVSKTDITVTDILGSIQKINMEYAEGKYILDLSNQATGLYLLTVATEYDSQTYKLFKN